MALNAGNRGGELDEALECPEMQLVNHGLSLVFIPAGCLELRLHC